MHFRFNQCNADKGIKLDPGHHPKSCPDLDLWPVKPCMGGHLNLSMFRESHVETEIPWYHTSDVEMGATHGPVNQLNPETITPRYTPNTSPMLYCSCCYPSDSISAQASHSMAHLYGLWNESQVHWNLSKGTNHRIRKMVSIHRYLPKTESIIMQTVGTKKLLHWWIVLLL